MLTILIEMWEFNLNDLTELQPHIDRLYEKKAKIEKSRPLPNSVLHKIKVQLNLA
ncbi:hypothetical protein [Pedobacter sp.]